MKSRSKLFSFLVVCILNSVSQTAAAALVSKSLGQAGERIITSRELTMNQMIERVFASTEAGKVHSDSQMDLSNLLLEKVLSLEASAFGVGTSSKSEIQEMIDRIEKTYALNDSWSKLEVGKVELERAVREKLEAKKFLKIKANSLQTEVSDDEAKLYFEKNRIKFGNLPFESFKDNIKSFMNQQQLEEKLKAWFEVVKRKYKVKVFANSGLDSMLETKADAKAKEAAEEPSSNKK